LEKAKTPAVEMGEGNVDYRLSEGKILPEEIRIGKRL
jgi:hypothetical protein